jgi:hypothetical protein
MEDEEVEKLAIFQSITRVENLEDCLMFMESSQWDTEASDSRLSEIFSSL